MKGIITTYIHKYFNDELTKEELHHFHMLLANKKNIDLLHDYIIANHIAEIHLKSFNSKKAFGKFESAAKVKKTPVYTLKRTAIRLLKYAAILICAFTIFNTDIFDSRPDRIIHIKVPKGEQKEVILPDGTQVWLNADSYMSYQANFNEQASRDVYLEGEGLFDVVDNQHKPFVVEMASELQVKVLGTVFNIRSYIEDSNTEATLLSGKIELSHKVDREIKRILYPGDQADYEKNEHKLSFSKVRNFEDIISWKDNKLTFANEPLLNIVNELNRFYKVEISIADKQLQGQMYTGSFSKKKSLEEILEDLSLSGNFEHKRTSNTKWIILTKN